MTAQQQITEKWFVLDEVTNEVFGPFDSFDEAHDNAPVPDDHTFQVIEGITGAQVVNDSTLLAFRAIAETLAGPEPRGWQWIGPHLSQRMFGITEQRARDYAARHGGTASKMEAIR